MYMADKLFKDNSINPLDKLILAYILRGHLRQKYISLETFSKEIGQSEPTISKGIKRLEALGLVKWLKVENNKYKIIVVCQKAFNKYAFLSKGEKVNENRLTKDNVINTFAEMEASKDLITFDKKEIQKSYNNNNGLRKAVVPNWYDEYKNHDYKPKEMTEEEEKELKEIIKTMF